MASFDGKIFLRNKYTSETKPIGEAFTEVLDINCKHYPHSFVGFEFFNADGDGVVPSSGTIDIKVELETFPHMFLTIENSPLDLSSLSAVPSFQGVPSKILVTPTNIVGAATYKLILTQQTT